jgi:uncharacterized protein
MSLQFNIVALLKSMVGSTRTFDIESDVPLELDESTVATDICGHVKLTLTNFGILASAQARAQLHLTCARCLEPFETPVSVTFEEEFRPIVDVDTGLPTDTIHTDSEFTIAPNHVVDLTEALRQHLLLAEEIVPICRPDCLGLCPTCGTNLNGGACGCVAAEDDSPFAALQTLFANTDSER